MQRNKRRKKSGNPGSIVLILALAAALLIGAPLLIDSLEVEYYDVLTVEAGSVVEAKDFLPANEAAERKKAEFVTDVSAISMVALGDYPVQIQVGDKLFSSFLRIVDTVAPKAEGTTATLYNVENPDPKDLVADLSDATEVTATVTPALDVTVTTPQEVTITLTDAGGNKTTVTSHITVINDKEAPVISGVADFTVYLGDAVAYKSGVTVTDNLDENPTLEVDSSQVDLSKLGTYSVVYTAKDHANNETKRTVKLTVQEKPDNYVEPEVIYARVDAILAQFITDDMTDREKVEAVYVWTHRGDHLNYGSAPDRTDWLQTANEILDTKKGDCFWFFAIQKLMLQRLGIPTIDVKKVKNFPEDSNHYWLLVSIDGGKTYYHYDNVWSKYLCLVTDAKLDAFSKAQKNCFNRDKSLYPATPTENLPASTLPWNDPKIMAAKP